MIPFEKYMVWQCISCGKWQGKQNNKWTHGMSDRDKSESLNKLTLNCIKCRRSVKFRDQRKGMTRLNFYFLDHPSKMPLMVQQLEELAHTKKN